LDEDFLWRPRGFWGGNSSCSRDCRGKRVLLRLGGRRAFRIGRGSWLCRRLSANAVHPTYAGRDQHCASNAALRAA
jgi:hypothetical protein